MHQVYLLTGGNIGNRKQNLSLAASKINHEIGIVTCKSALYESAPWGFEHEHLFLNQVLMVQTELPPMIVLEKCLKIENELGRERIQNASQYMARIIDIDVLFYDNVIIQSDSLTIPHPHIHKRMFTLAPLNEIAPNYIHPILKQTMTQLLNECDDKSEVVVYNERY